MERSIIFFNILGLKELRRKEIPEEKQTLVYMAIKEGDLEFELTRNWDKKTHYTVGQNFGHIAFIVKDIYDVCKNFLDVGVTISQPPRDGKIAFIKTPDEITIEIIQEGDSLKPKEPWKSMENKGSF